MRRLVPIPEWHPTAVQVLEVLPCSACGQNTTWDDGYALQGNRSSWVLCLPCVIGAAHDAEALFAAVATRQKPENL